MAQSLGGRNTAVSAGAASTSVAFNTQMPTATYLVFVAPNWVTAYSVTGKSTTGFTVTFAVPATTPRAGRSTGRREGNGHRSLDSDGQGLGAQPSPLRGVRRAT